MRRFFLVSTAVALMASSAVMAQAWQEYENRAEGFLINFPGEPKVDNRSYTTASGASVSAKVYAVELPSGRYAMTFVDFASNRQDEAQTISHAVNALRQKGRPRYDDVHDLDGVSGHQISIAEPDGRLLLGSVYFYNNRLYIMEASVPPGAAPPQQFQ